MKRAFLLVVVGFCWGIGLTSAQSSVAADKDSLLALLEKNEVRDSVRVNLLIDLQAHFLIDEHQKGKSFIEEALSISKEIGYKTGEGFSRNALGAFFLRQGENQKAIESTLRAIEIFEEIGENQNIYAAYNNLALLYKRLGRFQEAVDVYFRMLEKLEGRTETPSFAVVYFNLATTYQAMNNLDEYEFWLNKMLSLSEKLNFQMGEMQAKLGLAELNVRQKSYEYGVQLAESVLSLVRDRGMAQVEAKANQVLGLGYRGLGQFRKALAYAKKSEEIYTEINDPTQLMSVTSLITGLHEDLGDWKSAFSYQNIYHNLSDSLLSEDRIKTIEELRTKYETERIEREKDQAELENYRLEEENRKGRNLLFGSVGLLVFGTLAGGMFVRQQRLKKHSELKDLELKETQKRLVIEQQKREAELKAVRAQLNPHFLFNLMNSVQELSLSGDVNTANNVLQNVAALMRKILANSQHDEVFLKDELSLVELYLEAEKIRFEEKLSYEINLHEDVEDEFISIPSMLIQPHVENAVKHGLMHKMSDSNEGKITISIKIDHQDQLSIVVEDNGVGRTKAGELTRMRPEEHNGFSTKANEERLRLIVEQTGRPAGVTIEDLYSDEEKEKATGTRVCITFPIQY